MARKQPSRGKINIDAVIHAVEDDPKPEVVVDRVVEAVAAGHGAEVDTIENLPAETLAPVAAAPAEPVAKVPASPDTFEASDAEDDTMADENTTAATDTHTAADFAGTVQDRMKAFYDRSTGLASEMTDLSRGNVEAVVESGRILASGLQDISRAALDETRTTFETMTADVKRMAAATSPTELLHLQSELARRNLDAFVNHGSKTTETMLKLANDAFAPVASRMSVAAEKLTKAA